ncbi:sigma-70 region 4 domain-containing protein [Streptomyces sp. NPDC055085]
MRGRAPCRFRPGGGVARTGDGGSVLRAGVEAVRNQLEINQAAGGLYEAILDLPTRPFTVIVLRHLLGYPTKRIARYMGLDTRTVDYHGRKGKKRCASSSACPP